MADELDAMLEGPDAGLASQAQIGDQGTDITQDNPVTQQSPEEIEFNKLSGSAQDRIKKLVQRARMAEEKAVGYQSPAYTPPPAPGYRDPQVEDAVRKLSEVGMATKDDVTSTINSSINGLRWEYEQNRLESKYTGSKGEPQYVREEVEDYIRAHPQFNGYAAEDVFKFKMFPDEFSNLEFSQRGSKTGKSSTLRPTKALTQQEGMTPEYIEERLKQPDGRRWYDEHLDEINGALQKMDPNYQQ